MKTGLPKHPYANVVWLDYETFCDLDITEVGLYRYMAHSSFRIIMAQIAINDGPVTVLDETTGDFQNQLKKLASILNRPDVLVVAHNAMFEVLATLVGLRVKIPLERVRCTMVHALLHGMPASLDGLCHALPVPEQYKKMNHKRAKALINRFCKPAPANHKASYYNHLSHPKEWAEFQEYGELDIHAMRHVVSLLPNVNCTEEAYQQWMQTEAMNMRGVNVDVELAQRGAAKAITDKQDLINEFMRITGLKTKPTQRKAFLEWLIAQGADVPDTTKDSLNTYLTNHDDVPEVVKRAIDISIQCNKNSVSKYARMEQIVSKDNRYRGCIQFAGAGTTRRDAGRAFQLQNLPSRGIPDNKVILEYIRRVKMELCTADLGDDVLLGSAALRGLLIATPGCGVVVADQANVEGRVVAWLANDVVKMNKFRAFDAGTGHDIYKLTAAAILGRKVEDITKELRNAIGKVAELSLGYSAGVNGLQNFCGDTELSSFWDNMKGTIHPDVFEKAYGNWDFFGKDQNKPLSRINMTDAQWHKEWLASEVVKLSWRAQHPRIQQLWKDCNEAALAAIRNHGALYRAGMHLSFQCVELAGSLWLLMRLPSGNYVTYYEPQINVDGEMSSMRSDPITKQWVRSKIYGGVFTANATQATARDVIMGNVKYMIEDGWHPILRVHDEVVAERPLNPNFRAQAQKFVETIAQVPKWAKGLPLAADGDITDRYGKLPGELVAVGQPER